VSERIREAVSKLIIYFHLKYLITIKQTYATKSQKTATTKLIKELK